MEPYSAHHGKSTSCHTTFLANITFTLCDCSWSTAQALRNDPRASVCVQPANHQETPPHKAAVHWYSDSIRLGKMVVRVDQIGLTSCIGRLRRLSAFKMLKTESTSSGCSPTLDDTLSRCISIPLATAWAYKERPCLSKELHENLRRVQDDFEPAHAVAVTGPEGTGKTQLVLRFIEENEQDYDVVLWIDVQSEEAVRSSFERCCHTLCLPFDSSATHASLQGMPCV